MARLIVRIHPPRSGKKSELARYLAEKSAPLRRETEGAKARPLFNDAEENLTCRRAESSLTHGGTALDKTDVKHFVVSLKRKEYELLGASRRERDAALIRIARQVMQLIAAETQTTRLKWYGAIHHNRPHHPHFHIGLSKHALDAHGRAPRRLEHLPKTLLPHHVRDAGGTRRFVPGKIIELVADHLDRTILTATRYVSLTAPDTSQPRVERTIEPDGRTLTRSAAHTPDGSNTAPVLRAPKPAAHTPKPSVPSTTTAPHRDETLLPRARRRSLVREIVPAAELETRAPTAEEELVGRWLVAEWEARTGERTPERAEELEELRRAVRRLDFQADLRAAARPRAALTPAQLLRMVTAETPECDARPHAEPPAELIARQNRRRAARLLGQALYVQIELDYARRRLDLAAPEPARPTAADEGRGARELQRRAWLRRLARLEAALAASPPDGAHLLSQFRTDHADAPPPLLTRRERARLIERAIESSDLQLLKRLIGGDEPEKRPLPPPTRARLVAHLELASLEVQLAARRLAEFDRQTTRRLSAPAINERSAAPPASRASFHEREMRPTDAPEAHASARVTSPAVGQEEEISERERRVRRLQRAQEVARTLRSAVEASGETPPPQSLTATRPTAPTGEPPPLPQAYYRPTETLRLAETAAELGEPRLIELAQRRLAETSARLQAAANPRAHWLAEQFAAFDARRVARATDQPAQIKDAARGAPEEKVRPPARARQETYRVSPAPRLDLLFRPVWLPTPDQFHTPDAPPRTAPKTPIDPPRTAPKTPIDPPRTEPPIQSPQPPRGGRAR